VRLKAYRMVAAARIRQGIAGAVCQVLLWKVGLPGTGLLVGFAVGQALGSSSLAKRTGIASKETVAAASPSHLWRLALGNWRFPALVTPSALINVLGSQLPTIQIAACYGATVAGWYALGQRIVGLPLFFVGRAVSQAYLGEGAEVAKTHPEELHKLFTRTAQRLSLIGVCMLGMIAIAAPFLVRQIFGSAWNNAGHYLQLMTPAILVQFVASPLSQTLNMVKKSGIGFTMDVCRLLLSGAPMLISIRLGFSASTAILMLSVGMTLSYLLYFLVYAVTLRSLRSETLDLQQS